MLPENLLQPNLLLVIPATEATSSCGLVNVPSHVDAGIMSLKGASQVSGTSHAIGAGSVSALSHAFGSRFVSNLSGILFPGMHNLAHSQRECVQQGLEFCAQPEADLMRTQQSLI